MTVTLTWQALTLLVTLFLGWSGFLVGVIKWLVGREIRNMENQVALAGQTARAAADDLKLHREEYLRFLGQLPLDYYRREDMIRFETITNAKLDSIAASMRQLECVKCLNTTAR